MIAQVAPSTTRLAEIAQRDPVAAPLALLHLAVAGVAGAAAAWDRALPTLDAEPLADGLPLLHRRTLAIDRRRARTVLDGVADAASQAGTSRAGEVRAALRRGALDPLHVLAASIRQDTGRLAELAAAAGVDLELLCVLGQLLSQPVLRAAGRHAQPLLEHTKWDAGYCPVCAAWPVLAERRGLERRRFLRCGRCATAWTYALRRCPYCGNGDHRRLGYLAPEAQREARQVATCDACHGYLKSIATVGALAPDEIAAHDLATLELDVAAMEHGYARPDERGFPLEVEVIDGHR